MGVLMVLPVFFLCLTLLVLYLHFKTSSEHWTERNVPHVKPIFLVGNLWRANILENIGLTLERMYLENKEKKILGFWNFHRPNLLVMDPDLIKTVLIKDFDYFRDRGLEFDESLDPIAGHLFTLSGLKWRNLRVKLTPTFTSGKMKFMFPTLVKCGNQLQDHLKKPAENREVIEVKDLMARFTTDVISSCAFGIDTNSLENPDSDFRKYGKDIFRPTLKSAMLNGLIRMYPKLQRILKVHLIRKDISDFFLNAVRDIVEYREREQVTRNDFLQLLIQLMRRGRIEDVDRVINGDDLTDEEPVQKFSLNEAAAQCFVFFAAGFETSSSALTYGLYELAKNPEVQVQLQEEISKVLEQGELTYDSLNAMEYLDMTVKEILRKHPSVGVLVRKCNADYEFPELKARIDHGTHILISIRGLHHDPQHYPDPERFDPERFSARNRKKLHAMAYLPFGGGHRNCIGERFGLMQVKIGLFCVLSKYTVEFARSTPLKIEHERTSVLPVLKGGMPLRFSART